MSKRSKAIRKIVHEIKIVETRNFDYDVLLNEGLLVYKKEAESSGNAQEERTKPATIKDI